MSGNVGYVESHSIEGNVVTIKFSDESPETYASISLNTTVSFVGSALTETHEIKILNDDVIMTIDTNPVVFKALKNAGYISDDAVLLRNVAQNITDIGTSLSNLRTAFTFDEISEFTGLRSLADNAFTNSYIENIEIPDFIKTIGKGAFSNCTMLTAVTLPTCEEYNVISESTFVNCTRLSRIVVPNNVKTISSYAFGGLPLIYSITTSVTATNAVVIGNGLMSIEDYAFETRAEDRKTLGCLITSITITQNLASSPSTQLDKYLLLAPKLEEIIVDENNTRYKSFDNVLYSPNGYILYRYPSGKKLDLYDEGIYEAHQNCHRIDEFAFFKAGAFSTEATLTNQYIGQLLTLKLSGLIEDTTYKAIGNYAFEASTIRTIDLSENDELRILPFGAFQNCEKLHTILFPKSLYEIQQQSFNGCNSLTSLVIPDSVEVVGGTSIMNCALLERLVLPRNMKYSSNAICYACPKLATVMLPCYHTGATETEEGERTNFDSFNRNTITSDNVIEYQQYKRYVNGELVEEDDGTIYFVYDGTIYQRDNNGTPMVFRSPRGKSTSEICEGTKEIMEYAYADSKIETIVIPGTVKTINRNAFASATHLLSVRMEEGVSIISKEAFRNCTSLINLSMPDSLSDIGDNAFQYCVSLRKVTIPKNVRDLDFWEFANCNSLKEVTIMARDFRSIGKRPFNYVELETMRILSLTKPSIETSTMESNIFSGMTLYVPYDMASEYEADVNWMYYVNQGMQIRELTFDVDDNIYVKINGYHGENPYIVDPNNAMWGINYVGTLITSGEYEGYYSFNGIVNVVDNKPLEIRDGNISGTKIANIRLRLDEEVYDVDYVLGVNATRGVFSKSSILGSGTEIEQIEGMVTQADYDRLKCDVNSLKIKMNKLLLQ